MMMIGTSELDLDLPQQIQTVLLTEPKIEDHQVHLGAGELIDHLLATARHQGMDVVLQEIVYDHALQGSIILHDEDAHLAVLALAKVRAV